MAKSSSFAKLVAYSLDTSNIYLLEQWLQNMRRTIKEGKMMGSGYINYICRIVSNYCKRIQILTEKKLSPINKKLTSKLVEILLPYVNLIFYSGHLSSIERLCTDLAYLASDKTIPFIIDKSFSILEDYNIPHLDAISVLGRIIRPLLDPKIYPSGLESLPVILNISLAELVSADMFKSCKVLELYGQIASLVALDHSIDGVSVWAEEFFANLLAVLSELEESSENKQEKARNYKIEETLDINMQILVSSVSVDIYQAWVDEFIEFVKRNNCNNAEAEFGIIARCLANRSPEKVISNLLKLTENSLEKSENQLAWQLSLLISSCYYGTDYLISAFSSVESLISRLDDKNFAAAGDLLAGIINGLIGMYPLSYNPYTPSVINNYIDQNVLRGQISNQTEDLQLEIQ